MDEYEKLEEELQGLYEVCKMISFGLQTACLYQ